MAYDLEEQETLAELKAWWKKYGNWTLWAAIVVLAAYAAWMFWGNYQRRQSEQASHLYYEIQKAVQANDNAHVQRIATDVQEKFGGTAYAAMASLLASRMAYELKDMDAAKRQLRWVADNGDGEGYRALARLRLAGILFDEKAYAPALELLSAEVPEAFVSLVEDRKGDILYAQNKMDEAKVAYETALKKAVADDPGKAVIRLKLEDLGVAAPETE
ncbi:MAG: tetratricopeptide repeat protein [Burkholderiaceae bacterium]|jgi:predicted negative regulator of RcsB-dependent stress response|nr:tetratricopeptide repeat protein [Burkholderiaceae bacterium]